MRIAVVVVAWNGEAWLAECLDSIVSQETVPDTVIIDNGSDDHTVRIAESRRTAIQERGARFEVRRLDANTGFASGANRGLEIVLNETDPADAILLLNQDAMLGPGCLEAFSAAMQRQPRAGSLGAKILYPGNGAIQHAGGYLERPRMVGLHHGHHEPDNDAAFNEEREVEFVTGAAMMLRSATLREVGLFNEVFSPGYFEDVELCDRIRAAGWTVLYIPGARVTHRESSSFSDRMARLRLAHRNRYIYAISNFDDDEFSQQFLAAEVTFLDQQASFDEIRAVSGGTLEALARLVPFARLRLGGQNAAASGLENARRVFLEVRNACNRLLLGR